MIVSYIATVLEVLIHKARQLSKDTDSPDEFPKMSIAENKSDNEMVRTRNNNFTDDLRQLTVAA